MLSMKVFNFSKPALSVLNKFHRKKILIYVEEKDDKLFWGKFIERSEILNYHIEICGGKLRLLDTYKKLKNTNTPFIIMCDDDYDSILGKEIVDYRFIHSYGYSIENTLYCPSNVSRVISNEIREIADITDEIQKWYKFTETNCRDLLICDLASMKFQKNLCVMGESCGKFCELKDSIYIESKRTILHLESLIDKFDLSELNICHKLIKNDPRDIRYLIRGHFLTLLILNYINYKVRTNSEKEKFSLSKHNLFSSLIDGCSLCGKVKCEENEFIKRKLIKIKKKYSI